MLSTFLGFDGVPAELSEPATRCPRRVRCRPIPRRSGRCGRWPGRSATRGGAVGSRAGCPRWTARRHAGPPAGRSRVGDEPAGRELAGDEVERVLNAYGLHLVPSREVVGPGEARPPRPRWAGRWHCDRAAAVRLHLRDEHALADAWEGLNLAEDGRADVQAMAARGVDTVFGVEDDAAFGALVSFGVGGVATDLLGDRAYAAVPLTDRTQPIWSRARGRRRCSPATRRRTGRPGTLLSDVALRLSRSVRRAAGRRRPGRRGGRVGHRHTPVMGVDPGGPVTVTRGGPPPVARHVGRAGCPACK